MNDLNNEQQEAVKNINGPCLVIAGAGSGKTRVLIYRIAYLLSSGIKANTILALTFTNKAANEMKERISKLVDADIAKYLWMGTFHSIFARILRFEAAHLEYSSNYTIYDTSDSLNLIRTIIKELDLDPETYKANNVLKSISSAKNNLITAPAYANNHQLIERDRRYRKPEIANIYRIYAGRCLKSDAMDFDDLLLNTNLLFRNNPDILTKYQQKFNYILVDEYQDTNFSQYLIVKKLAAKHKNVCVVGDDFQSIYAFRGANIGNILNFKDDYPEYKLYKLEQNYRSTQNIVNAANSVIAKNKNQIHKKLFSKNIKGDKIKVIQALTDNEEGYIISNSIIESKIKENYNYNDYAILYRTNAQSRIFEESLRKQSIPYKIYGGLSFYQRKEIKDILAYFRLIINKNDDDALKRIINYPVRGIGKTTINKIEWLSREKDTNMWNILADIDKYEPALNKRTANINNFVALLKDFSEKLPTLDAYDLAHYVASKTGILKELSNDKSPENISKYENIQELLNGIKVFTTKKENEEDNVGLDKYLEDVVLLTNEDYGKKEDKNKVTLLTVHSAKGLEFKNVYIVKKDVDFSTGNINFSGSVMVNGDVRSGFKIIAQDDVQVNGVVEDAVIESNGNVLLKTGFVGRGKGQIIAQGDVTVKFCENETIISEGDIYISEYVMHSKIITKGNLYVTDKTGLIVGGETYAVKCIEANVVGNENYTPTKLFVGVDMVTKAYLEKNVEHIIGIEKILNKFFRRKLLKRELPEEKKNLIDKLKQLRNEKVKENDKLIAEIEKSDDRADELNKAVVKIYDVVFPGTSITIYNKHLTVNEPIKYVYYKYTENEIVAVDLEELV